MPANTMLLYKVATALLDDQWSRREVSTGACVADLASIDGGKIHLWEFKSNADTLARLPAQLASYSKCAELVTVVLDDKHWLGAQKIIEKDFPWVGLVRVNVCNPTLTVVDPLRKAKPTPAPSFRATARLLREYEMQAWLEELGVARGVRGRGRPTMMTRLAKHADIALVRERITKCWPVRDWSVLSVKPQRDECQSTSTSSL